MTMQCLICHRGASAVGYVCEPCRDRLAQWLHDIGREAELLSAVPSMAQPSGTRGGTLASHRAPARVDVLVLTDPRLNTDSTLAVLHAWATTIRDDRTLTPPDRITIATERRLLSSHLDWAAAQPWIDEMAEQLRGLRAQLQHANGTHPEPPMGRCYLTVNDGHTCDGPIWIDHTTSHARCGRCHATWTGAQLAHLHLILDQAMREQHRPHTDDGRPMYTATELVERGHCTSVSNVRVRAHRAGIRATDGHYDPQLFTTTEQAPRLASPQITRV